MCGAYNDVVNAQKKQNDATINIKNLLEAGSYRLLQTEGHRADKGDGGYV
jgi:hypothetical protein